jgi:hypothetical protein
MSGDSTGGGNRQKKRTNRLRQKNWKQPRKIQEWKARTRANEGRLCGELATIILSLVRKCGLSGCYAAEEVDQRDPEAPEVTGSGKQREPPNREHISESGLPRLRSLESSANRSFPFSYKSCAAIDHSPVCTGPRGNVTARSQCTRTSRQLPEDLVDDCLRSRESLHFRLP